MFSIPISKTKIIPPRRRAELLTRKRLLNHLFEALDNKLVLVSAPAGYGKTSLLIDAVKESEFKCCWLSLDELDRDPQRFLAYLVSSIAEGFPGVGAQTASVMKNITSFENEIERLAVTLVNEAFEGINEHFVLILDDFHILDGVQPIYEFLNRFIQLVDDNCHVIISSRVLTALADLPLMAAREQVRGLSFSDLAFQVNEIQALLQQNKNVLLSDEDAEKMFKESEGWITGLQFGVYEKDRKSGVGLSDYLGQQVLDRQTPQMREILLRTSLMDEFDSSMCEQVLGPFYESKQDWDFFLRSILSNNLFALPVGSDGSYLRYHHLFRDYLRERIKKERPDEVRPILERLSHVYETIGEWEKAYAIIRTLGDVNLLVELIDLTSFNNLQDTMRLIENWIHDLPPSVQRNHPLIVSINGTIKLIKGDTQGGIRQLETAIEVFQIEGNIPHLALSLIRRSYGYLYLGDYQSGIADLENVIRLVEDQDDLQQLHAEALHVMSSYMMRLGKNRSALKLIEKAMDIRIRLNGSKDIARTLADIGGIYQFSGKYDEAEKNLNKALEIYSRDFNLIEEANLLNNLGFMFYQNGNYEKAAFSFEEGMLCAKRSRHVRLETLLSISIGDLYTRLNDSEIAEQNYRHAENLLEERDDQFLLFSLLIGQANLALLRRDLFAAGQLIDSLGETVKKNSSHYDNGQFNLLLGKFDMFSGEFVGAVSKLEKAELCFLQDELTLDVISARIWLSAAYVANGHSTTAIQKIKETIGNKPQHVALIAASQSLKWLKPLQKDIKAGREVRDLLGRAEKLADQLPDIRRELRRQARVVEVPVAQLVINGFGNSKVLRDGRELSPSDWQTQSVRELFFFFLSQDVPLTKEQVASRFWQELDDPAKLKLRFKNDMYRLRRAVGSEVVRFENNQYVFNRSLNYEYDVEAFESHLLRARSAKETEELIEFYTRAVDLFAGPYLNDMYFDWVIADRERLDQMYLATLITLADLHQKQAELNEALIVCQRAIDYSPIYEAAYCSTMQVYARMQNRTAVIQTYEACKSALKKHLSMPPSPETEALYKKLLS